MSLARRGAFLLCVLVVSALLLLALSQAASDDTIFVNSHSVRDTLIDLYFTPPQEPSGTTLAVATAHTAAASTTAAAAAAPGAVVAAAAAANANARAAVPPLAQAQIAPEAPFRPGAAASGSTITASPVDPRCAGVLDADACSTWYATREAQPSPPPHGTKARPCPAGCHGRGRCDETSGLCACEAGFNGTACEERSVRRCNAPEDGLWVASHCAGECDERRGWCWCPGRVGQRQMGESCQVKYMPLEVFSALSLKPDANQRATTRSGAAVEGGTPQGTRRRREALRSAYAEDPTAHAALVQAWWFGDGQRGGATPHARASAPDVYINEDGVPHTRPRSAPPARGSSPDASALSARGRRLQTHNATAVAGQRRRLRAAGSARRARPAPHHGQLPRRFADGVSLGDSWHQKPSARGTHGYAQLLVQGAAEPLQAKGSARATPGPAWCEAEQGGPSPSHSCGCSIEGTHGPLCQGRHSARLRQPA